MDFAAAYLEETRAFGELIRYADPLTPVPTCPDWNLGQLFRHVGRGDRWAAQIVREKLDDRLDFRAVADGKPPADPDDAIGWLNDGAQLLLDAVEQCGAPTPVWTFLGPRPAGWWIRRRLHENAVHRADAAVALNTEFTLEPEVAADGIDEWLERVVIQAAANGVRPLQPGETIHLHATDPGLDSAGEWTIGMTDKGVTWSHEHGKGSVALRGPATELLLLILRRAELADTGVEFFGEDAIWRNWLGHTPL